MIILLRTESLLTRVAQRRKAERLTASKELNIDLMYKSATPMQPYSSHTAKDPKKPSDRNRN